MKALVLAAGAGTRIAPLERAACKGILRLAGIPLVEYSFRHAVAAGVSAIVVVISERAEVIRRRYGAAYCGVPLRYARQDTALGLVHAIEVGAPLLGDEDFMLFLSDEILIDADHAGMVRRFHAGGLSAVCGVVEDAAPERIRCNYDVIGGAGRRIVRLVEKPAAPQGTLLGLGNCIFRRAVLEHLAEVPVNPVRGQRDLTDLIQCAIDAGHRVEHYPLCRHYVNVNTPDDFERARSLVKTARAVRLPATATAGVSLPAPQPVHL